MISEMSAQNVANVIWAVVKLATNGAASESLLGLLPVVADRASAVISEMTAQHVANVIWATGQLYAEPSHSQVSQQLHDLLPDLVVRAREVLPSAKPQAFSNACWGLALSEYHDIGFLQAVSARVVSEASTWHPRAAELDLPSVLFAFARLNAEGDDDMLDVAAEKLAPILPRINDWGLCALAWSYSQLDAGDNFFSFRQSLNAEVARRDFSEQDVEQSRLGPNRWWKDHAGTG